MPQPVEIPPDRLEAGRVLAASWQVFRSRWWQFLALVLVLIILPNWGLPKLIPGQPSQDIDFLFEQIQDTSGLGPSVFDTVLRLMPVFLMDIVLWILHFISRIWALWMVFQAMGKRPLFRPDNPRHWFWALLIFLFVEAFDRSCSCGAFRTSFGNCGNHAYRQYDGLAEFFDRNNGGRITGLVCADLYINFHRVTLGKWRSWSGSTGRYFYLNTVRLGQFDRENQFSN
jgi:hypothetical protein